MSDSEDKRHATELIKSGAEIAGASVIAAAGTLFVGPEAAAVFGAAAVLLPRITALVIDYASRSLSPRERARIGAATAVAASEFRRRLELGEEPRSDGFILGSEERRSGAEEVFDGALQKARMQYEELKAGYFGHLFASVAFDEGVSQGEANRLLDVLDRLTYRKLCLLALFDDRRRPSNLLSQPVGTLVGPPELYSLAQDCFELEASGLIYPVNTDADPSFGRPDWRHTVPSHLRVSELGKQLVELAGLNGIPTEELARLGTALSAPS